ncbi:hypothetical protein TNCV_3780891 [Trichonephila clavipes]|nr:hypothetical protein TNCV_3780891 [Trichonephila clavipes]
MSVVNCPINDNRLSCTRGDHDRKLVENGCKGVARIRSSLQRKQGTSWNGDAHDPSQYLAIPYNTITPNLVLAVFIRSGAKRQGWKKTGGPGVVRI